MNVLDSKSDGDGWAVINDFLCQIYGSEDAASQVWVTGFADIETSAWWMGVQGVDRLRARMGAVGVDNADLYFCTGLLRKGAERRKNGEVEAQVLLFADDVGTKVPFERWDTMFALGFPQPTFKIETSPGNETWGWKLGGDATSVERKEELIRLRAFMIERELTDEISDATRYLRLPWGHNSKPKYKDSKNRSPAVGYTDWSPENVVNDLDVLGRMLGGIDWRTRELPKGARTSSETIGSGGGKRDASMEDTYVRMAAEIGLNPYFKGDGVVGALCPNMAEHTIGTAQVETGFDFIGQDGACYCNHASCRETRIPDFLATIRTQYEEHVSGLNHAGKNEHGLPASASAFLAGVAFGVDDETANRLVEEEANALASRNARRVEQAKETIEQGLDNLAERFVWVQEAEAFFDTKLRCMLSDKALIRHEDVKGYIKPGKVGAASAPNVLMAHPGLRNCFALTYKPGAADALVVANTESGTQALHVNGWVGSNISRRAEPPKVWMELIEHLLPCPDFRNWFLDWNAYRVQNPGARTPVFPLIVGGQGTGKDLALAPLVTIEGSQNVQFVNMSRMDSAFNDWMRSSLVVLPELKLSSDGKLYNQLKDWTGQNAGRVQINTKYARTYTIEPSANFLAFTNHLDAVKGMEADDRRVATYVSPAEPKAVQWYTAAAPVLHGVAEAERVYDNLMSRDLSAFNPHQVPAAAITSKQRMLIDNLSEGGAWVHDELSLGGNFADRKYLTIAEIEAFAGSAAPLGLRNRITANVIRAGMLSAGCENIGQIRAGKDRQSIWFGPLASEEDKKSVRTKGKKAAADGLAAERKAAVLGVINAA